MKGTLPPDLATFASKPAPELLEAFAVVLRRGDLAAVMAQLDQEREGLAIALPGALAGLPGLAAAARAGVPALLIMPRQDIDRMAAAAKLAASPCPAGAVPLLLLGVAHKARGAFYPAALAALALNLATSQPTRGTA